MHTYTYIFLYVCVCLNFAVLACDRCWDQWNVSLLFQPVHAAEVIDANIHIKMLFCMQDIAVFLTGWIWNYLWRCDQVNPKLSLEVMICWSWNRRCVSALILSPNNGWYKYIDLFVLWDCITSAVFHSVAQLNLIICPRVASPRCNAIRVSCTDSLQQLFHDRVARLFPTVCPDRLAS